MRRSGSQREGDLRTLGRAEDQKVSLSPQGLKLMLGMLEEDMAPSGGCRLQESRTGGEGVVKTEVDQRYGLRPASEYCVWQAKELGFFFFFNLLSMEMVWSDC